MTEQTNEPNVAALTATFLKDLDTIISDLSGQAGELGKRANAIRDAREALQRQVKAAAQTAEQGRAQAKAAELIGDEDGRQAAMGAVRAALADADAARAALAEPPSREAADLAAAAEALRQLAHASATAVNELLLCGGALQRHAGFCAVADVASRAVTTASGK